jgi:hypothetical protein
MGSKDHDALKSLSQGQAVEDQAKKSTAEDDADVDRAEDKARKDGRQRDETPRDAYFRNVTEAAEQSAMWMPVVDQRKEELEQIGGGSMLDHIVSTFQSSGISDPIQRFNEVEIAVRRQLQLMQEKKSRKKDRFRDAARKAGQLAPEKQEKAKASENLVQAVREAVNEQVWTEVSSFKTKEQAVGFILECQPFAFTPLLEEGEAPLPKFENSQELVEYVMQIVPVPMKYESSVAEFKRTLRIRLVDIEEQEDPARKAISTGRRRMSALRKNTVVVPRKEPKPWLVEATGSFFESPTSTSLRCPKEDRKFFIAVAQDVTQTVLQEGYKVKLRYSIPCSATPAEALAAWNKNDQKAGRKPGEKKAIALPVVVPPEIDVVVHREKGFLIRCQELPASCFRSKKVGALGTTGVES